MIELDAVFLPQFPFVVLFEFLLRRRQMRFDRIINQVQRQVTLRLAVAQLVENLQRADA